MAEYPANILANELSSLPLSEEFKSHASAHGFHTLLEMVPIPMEDLENTVLQDRRLLLEYIQFIEEIGLGHLID